MKECCWVTQNTGKEKDDLLRYTHSAKEVDSSTYPCIFLPEKSWTRGPGKGWKKTLGIIQPRSPGCLPIARTGGKRDIPLPSLPLLLLVWGASRWMLQNCGVCWREILYGLPFDDFWMLLFPFSSFPSTMLQGLSKPWEVNAQKWHLGQKLGWGFFLGPLRVHPHAYLYLGYEWHHSEQTKLAHFTHSMWTHPFCDQWRFQKEEGEESPLSTAAEHCAVWLCIINPGWAPPKLVLSTEGEQVNQRRSDLTA